MGTGDEWHSFEDHTSEVEMHVRAPDLPALFARAGLALAELMLGEDTDLTPPAEGAVRERVVVTAPDREALLAAWLDELIFRAEVRKAVFTRFQIARLEDGLVEAEISGIPDPVIKTGVKAATFHNLRVTDDPNGGHRATVVLDV